MFILKKKSKMTILEPKKEKKIFLKIYFFSKMLNFQDFSKFSKILKSTVQYLSRDISNVKIGQFLRQSRKKHWKLIFCPTAFKIKKFNIPSHKFFEYQSSHYSVPTCMYVCVCIETIESTWVVKRGTAPSIYRYVCMWLKN